MPREPSDNDIDPTDDADPPEAVTEEEEWGEGDVEPLDTDTDIVPSSLLIVTSPLSVADTVSTTTVALTTTSSAVWAAAA